MTKKRKEKKRKEKKRKGSNQQKGKGYCHSFKKRLRCAPRGAAKRPKNDFEASGGLCCTCTSEGMRR
ncbi:hypothetical protein Hanom_Chr05g00422841 [Helianthus anomalus]